MAAGRHAVHRVRSDVGDARACRRLLHAAGTAAHSRPTRRVGVADAVRPAERDVRARVQRPHVAARCGERCAVATAVAARAAARATDGAAGAQGPTGAIGAAAGAGGAAVRQREHADRAVCGRGGGVRRRAGGMAAVGGGGRVRTARRRRVARRHARRAAVGRCRRRAHARRRGGSVRRRRRAAVDRGRPGSPRVQRPRHRIVPRKLRDRRLELRRRGAALRTRRRAAAASHLRAGGASRDGVKAQSPRLARRGRAPPRWRRADSRGRPRRRPRAAATRARRHRWGARARRRRSSDDCPRAVAEGSAAARRSDHADGAYCRRASGDVRHRPRVVAPRRRGLALRGARRRVCRVARGSHH